MTDLLDLAMEAHGGLQRWQQIEQLHAHIKVGGAVWHVKGWPDVYADIHTSVSAHRPHTEFTPFLEKGQHCVWEPEQTSIVADSGDVIEHRAAPRSLFEGHTITTPWDRQHLIYFTGYAMWTYLTTPFLFTLPGFRTEEIEPWQEEDETWRRLKVTFPSTVPSHSTVQTFYFNADGLLRRHDYSVDIMGGTRSANYASDHRSFAGLIIPTKRRVYATGPDNRPILDRVAVSIDLLDVGIEPQPIPS
ncbi:hypothetical protein FHX06_001286 [Rhizobium sp. BK512]|uniref:hypothetical protein n=1 Tax=Rhizobium sp. BK512 TaxID=2587010 RepID=UPI001609D42E|nr:hypothetical protein [Rhizobium sp. BK512]MBB3559975.1 hypothetical protein [Rhizobium sp. BK512]